MKNLWKNINYVLAEWDPIGVGQSIAIEEYQTYIPLILKYIKNRQQLMDCLEDILINKIGVSYDPRNKMHVKDLEEICDKLVKVYNLNEM